MRKTLFLPIALLITLVAGAQNIRVAVGKKCKMLTDTKTISGMSIMGQQVDISSNSKAIAEIEIKTINPNGYTLSATLKRITGSVNAMGQEQSFDSDDESTRNNPQMAEAFKMLNQSRELTVNNGKTITNEEVANFLTQMGGAENLVDAVKLILAVPVNQLKQGYHWSDSSVSAESSMINQYIITKADTKQVEVTVNTDLKINGTIKQAGMEIKQKMMGATTAIRVYTISNGLLISEISSIDMTGSAEVMGMSAPVTVKGTITTTIE